MNVYIDFLYFTISFIIMYLPITVTVQNRYLNFVKSGQGEVHPCAIGINFFTVLNNTSDEDFYIELLPDQCCLENSGSVDCESLNIVGECAELLPKGISETFHLIAPLLNPVERRGYCNFYVDSRPIDRKNRVMRDTIRVNFDTTIENNPQLVDIQPCHNQDEDPLNDCQPVNCETYYNGQKPFFDTNKKRCVRSKACTEDEIYDIKANDCKKCDSITERDLDFIKSLIQHGRPHKDVIIIKTVQMPRKKNITKVQEKKPVQEKHEQVEKKDEEAKERSDEKATPTEYEVTEDAEELNEQTAEEKKGVVGQSVTKSLQMISKTKPTCESCDVNYYFNKIICYVKANKFTLLVLVLIVLVQCCLLVAMVYYVKASKCCNKKKVVRKFFNYRQDASVTTPLIGTSNMDTEKTEFNYVTESSNDKKIKCYKACQKERNNQPKMSMSDDVLTKYLNRRDWNIKLKTEEQEQKAARTEPKAHEVTRVLEVTEEHENSKKLDTKQKAKHVEKGTEDMDYFKSEREIQSHDYYATTNTAFSVEKNSKDKSKKTASVSTEKGAQACFSNDSVDDLLSEKGILFFEENISKYSFSTPSPLAASSSTDRTSKTSKNNILKHFLSFISRKSKLAVTSEPGNNSRDKLELIHLHMSKGSVQSSSDSNVKKMKSQKFYKESRSTF